MISPDTPARGLLGPNLKVVRGGSLLAAHHEAGHAVAAWALGCRLRSAAIWSDAEEHWQGETRWTAPSDGFFRLLARESPEEAALREAVIAAAAMPATSLLARSVDVSFLGVEADLEQVREAGRGLGAAEPEAVEAFTRRAIGRATELIHAHTAALNRFAEALLERKQLHEREIRELLPRSGRAPALLTSP